MSLRVFDLRGRLVETLVDGPLPAGPHEVAWDAHGVPAGVYFVQLSNGTLHESRRMRRGVARGGTIRVDSP